MSPAGPYTSFDYDTHGNTTELGAEDRKYDAADRHISTDDGTTTITYVRDVTDRIVARSDGTTTIKYAYSATGDTGDAVLDNAGNVIQRTILLPGGVLLTKDATNGDVWSYPNNHGDVAAVANASGVKQGPTRTYDPDGNPLNALPDNSAGSMDYGWLGQHQRPFEHQANLIPTIEMAARQYVPGLGRFLEVDPIEGGSANDYDYVAGDPVILRDLDGRWPPRIRLPDPTRGIRKLVGGAAKATAKAAGRAIGRLNIRNGRLRRGAAGVSAESLRYATRPEKLDHIFVPKHNLDPLVSQFGSREAVVRQMLIGINGRTPEGGGVFEIPVVIGGQTVVVRGAVVQGVIKLGTAFTP